MKSQSRARVSVIVPIYNVSAFVTACVDSILSQTHQDLEVLLVDDGSTDGSGKICDDYAQADPRVRTIHRPNGGLSAARNSGLDVATGEYIICIDGDDVVTDDHVERLLAEFNHPDVDIAIAQFQSTQPRAHYERVAPSEVSPTTRLERDDALVRLFRLSGLTNSAWGKLYRANLFEGVRYPEGALYEDLPTTYRLFMRARSVALTSHASYYYIQRSTSITAMRDSVRRLVAFGFAADAVKEVSTHPPRVQRAARSRLFMESVFYLSETSGRLRDIPARAVAPLRALRREVLFDRESTPSSRMFALVAFLGPGAVRAAAAVRLRLYSLKHSLGHVLRKDSRS